MTTWQSLNRENQEMVDKFTRLAIIQSKEVENAFRCVNRAAFVFKELMPEAFTDAPLRGSKHLHMSAPHIYANILEDLELEPGMSFLNIGSGTGYFSCLAGYLIKSHGINHGIELHEDMVEFAHDRVKDFINNGPSDSADICQPLLIAGNGFLLDPNQMKYDRLYCGGACPQSTVTFFLQFLKVGGFLIAPVGTKLIKLERVSQQEGVKTALSDVCFTPLTRLDTREKNKLKAGLIPLIRFPIKTRKKKPKKLLFPSVTFPVSSSQARKKLSRLRAIQHALDSLEKEGRIPIAFCYVPNISQINNYKQYKKLLECKGFVKHSKTNQNETATLSTDRSAGTSHRDADVAGTSPYIAPSVIQTHNTRLWERMNQHLMTLQEFLSAASDYHDLAINSSTNSDGVENNGEFSRQRLSSTNGSPRNDSFENLSRATSSVRDGQSYASVSAMSIVKEKTEKEIIEYSEHDFDITGKTTDDIFEHLCSDKLWENVLDYYYSVCTTTQKRKTKCFELKGIDIVEPNINKLADTLVFKTNMKKLEKNEKSKKRKCIPTETAKCEKPDINVTSDEKVNEEVEQLLQELVDKVSDAFCVNDEKPPLSHSSDNCTNNGNSRKHLHSKERAVDNGKKQTVNLSGVRKRDDIVNMGKTKFKKYVDIRTDPETAEKLSVMSNVKWTRKHDIDLISYLVNFTKNGEQHVRVSIPKDLTPDMFDQSKLIKYPSLSSIDSSMLCSRAIGLQRVAKVLDSVLEILVGPSLKRDQFENPDKVKYPLVSFTDFSFKSSDSQLNVVDAQKHEPATSTDKEDDEEENEVLVYQEALSPEDEELLKEVKAMITFELSNVHQQQMILVKKVRLIDNIDEQYKEQVKLLNQQVQLLDEQQRLLVDVQIETTSLGTDRQGPSCQHLVAERKQQRQSLLVKRDRINTERENQLVEKKEILSMLEQLLTLDARLKNELKSLKKKRMGYLRGGENDLSSFSKFVQKADTILKKLRVSSTKIKCQSDERSEVEKEKVEGDATAPSHRYHPETILPRCRFLLPLSKKRHSFVKEMLRSTERAPPPGGMPVINVDRRIPVNERCKHGELSTVFMQIYSALKNKDLHYRWNKKSYSQWWEVKFHGEGIIDQGGGFRDSLTEMSEELCPPSADQDTCLPLFIRTPNQKSRLGDYLDCYILNPSCRRFPMYRWLGQLFGACFRTGETIPLSLPPYLWKLLVGEQVTWKDDFTQIDDAAVKNIDGLSNLEEDAYKALQIEQTYSTTLSDETEQDLIPNGSQIVVNCKERAKYSTMVRKARMMENIKQLNALREGLLTVIPEPVLACLTWDRLERGVCGNPNITVSELKANCRYGDRLSPTSPSVVHMWSALSSFSDDERSRFLRFITGRKRLPSSFIIFRPSSEGVPSDNVLPSASTCGSNLFLPEYSSAEVAKEKLRYAIYNCVAIDTDTSPW